jgi:OOP family OmpA-OmpF porin
MKKIVTNNDYNKWSIELAGGFNKPQRPMTGYLHRPDLELDTCLTTNLV